MAINRRAGSVPERILSSHLYQVGEPFTSKEMSRILGTTASAVAAACATLRALGKLETNNLVHRRLMPMSISKTPIRTQYFEWESREIGPLEWTR